MKTIETSYGTIKFKSVIQDGEFSTLVEGTEFYYEDGSLIGFVEDLFVNDEILDRDNIPEPYGEEDYILQQERVDEALSLII